MEITSTTSVYCMATGLCLVNHTTRQFGSRLNWIWHTWLCSTGYKTNRAFSFYLFSIPCTVFTPYQITRKNTKSTSLRLDQVSCGVLCCLCKVVYTQSILWSTRPLSAAYLYPFHRGTWGHLVAVTSFYFYFIHPQVKMNNMEYISTFSPIKTCKLNVNVNKHFYE